MVEDVVSLARGWIGTPYQHQASTKARTDADEETSRT